MPLPKQQKPGTTPRLLVPKVETKELVTNYSERGLQNGRGGGDLKFYPYKKGGGQEKVLAMLKGGHKKVLGSFFRGSLKF